MKSINIIHLSDIHYEKTEENDKLLDNLQKDLENQKNEFEEYHLMIISGDIVNKGNVKCYDSFKKKLNKILSVCGISKKRVITTIGNHDVNLNNPWLASMLESSKEDTVDIANKIQGQIGALYQEYNNFNKPYATNQSGVGVIDVPIKDSNKNQIMRLRVITLNSSWSAAIGKGYGNLIIGDEQINEIKNQINGYRIKTYDYTFLCMHHPLDWFEYSERIKIEKLIESFNIKFIFHGHIHESNVKNLNDIDTTTHSLCTGISYRKSGETSSRKSGMRYSIYQLDKDTKTMNVYIRSTNEKGFFVEDTTLYNNVKNGFFTIPLESMYKCLFPFPSCNKIPKKYAMLTKDNFEKILSKEKSLFEIYCAMENYINNMYTKNCDNYKKNYEKYKADWQNLKGLKRLNKVEREKLDLDFANEQFGEFCFQLLLNLNSQFFHGDVRFLLRKYNPDSNKHEAFAADGPNSNKIEDITNFTWKEGLIYQSAIKGKALLQSANLKYFKKGNTNNWINCLTLVVDGINIFTKNEKIPILALNIAISSEKDEPCLEALALSSIYEKIGAIFDLYDKRVEKIKKILKMEDE